MKVVTLDRGRPRPRLRRGFVRIYLGGVDPSGEPWPGVAAGGVAFSGGDLPVMPGSLGFGGMASDPLIAAPLPLLMPPLFELPIWSPAPGAGAVAGAAMLVSDACGAGFAPIEPAESPIDARWLGLAAR